MPPIGFGKEYGRHQCHMCEPQHNSFKQYAITAYSPQDVERFYTASRATGPPDVVSFCKPDQNAWLPVNDCGDEGCYLEVSFENVVIATSIKIWVTYIPKDSIKNIKLFHSDNTTTFLGK